MQVLTLDEALNMAGIDRDDDAWVRDCKFAAWIRDKSWAMIQSDQPRPQTAVDILIIKE